MVVLAIRARVLEAECTNPADYERIRGAIRGFEDDVDINVRVLMLAGAYTSTLRKAYDAGEDIRGAGILNLNWKVPSELMGRGFLLTAWVRILWRTCRQNPA
eukprot:Skav229923  [mRNA]  locus=scaffold3709:32246:36051:+ [translate_table: standard]